MNGFFRIDSGFNRGINKIMDIIWLNILTIICCLPIITIGCSITSMYYVLMKMSRNEEGYITKSFFLAFKENFKKSTLVWLMFASVLVIGSIDMKFMGNMRNMKILVFLLGGLAIFMMIGLTYVFPVMARYENSIKSSIKNAYIYAIACFPQTVFIIAIQIIPAFVAYEFGVTYLYFGLIGLSVPAYMSSKIFLTVFENKKFQTAK